MIALALYVVGLLIYSAWEIIGIWRFLPAAFKYGLPIATRRVDLASSPDWFPIGKVFQSGTARFVFLSRQSLLFRRSATGFMILPGLKGTATLTQGQITVVGRLPVGLPLFYLTGFGFAASSMWNHDGASIVDQLPAVFFMALALIVGVGMEVGRFDRACDEVIDRLGKRHFSDPL